MATYPAVTRRSEWLAQQFALADQAFDLEVADANAEMQHRIDRARRTYRARS